MGGVFACRNCGALLTGRYCADCGQKHEVGIPTVGHLLAEGVEGLTHADSRLWRTLRVLLTKPGFLTAEYFGGRRERYLPPIRLYLVLSFIAFLVLPLLSGSHSQEEQEEQAQQAAGVTHPAELGGDPDCAAIEYPGPLAETIQPRLRAACTRITADNGAAIGKAVLHSLPKAMFVLLPLVAAMMLAFYWQPRRRYAEHLLFLVHNHSAVFAVLTLEAALGRVLPPTIGDTLTAVLPFYLGWYGYRGMRRYYGDSRRRTLCKAMLIGFAYLMMAGLVLTFTGLAVALTL